MLGAEFGLQPDEWNFLAIFIGALVPLYIGLLRVRSDSKKVRHEVSHNGGLKPKDGSEPTVKDLVAGAYAESFAARITAEEARRSAQHVEQRLDAHIEVAEAQGASIVRRINEVEDAAKKAIIARDNGA